MSRLIFRLYAKILSTHGPSLAKCAMLLNELVKLVMLHIKHNIGKV